LRAKTIWSSNSKKELLIKGLSVFANNNFLLSVVTISSLFSNVTFSEEFNLSLMPKSLLKKMETQSPSFK